MFLFILYFCLFLFKLNHYNRLSDLFYSLTIQVIDEINYRFSIIFIRKDNKKHYHLDDK